MINVSQKVENPVKVVYFYADYSDLFRPKDTETLVCWTVRNMSTGEVSGLYEDQEEAEDNTSYSSPHTRSQIDMIINHHLS